VRQGSSSQRLDTVVRVSKYYAVRQGYQRGIFMSWPECELQVKGYSGAEFKSFKSYEAAIEYMERRV
jgi:viroplasmin and RNaseH domain-containing protein